MYTYVCTLTYLYKLVRMSTDSTSFNLNLPFYFRMQEKHAIIALDEKANKVNIKPCNTDCRVLVNGTPIQGETTLCHNDRSVAQTRERLIYPPAVQ